MTIDRRRTVLSTLWIFYLLNLFAKDLHEFGRPGMLDQISSGVVGGVVVTEGLMLVGGIMMAIPILMVLLSQILSFRVNKWLNLVVGLLTIAIVVYTNLDPDLDNIFFMVLQLLGLIGIVGLSARWKDADQSAGNAA